MLALAARTLSMATHGGLAKAHAATLQARDALSFKATRVHPATAADSVVISQQVSNAEEELAPGHFWSRIMKGVVRHYSTADH